MSLYIVANCDYTDDDCIAFAVLSHGSCNTLEAKDRPYPRTLIGSYFTPENCPSLSGKPKLIFIQACGVFNDHDIDPQLMFKIHTDDSVATDENTKDTATSKLMRHPDFLVFNATQRGIKEFNNFK